MSAALLLADLYESGINPRPSPDGKSLLLPANRLTDLQRQQLTAHKPEVLALLSDPLAQALMAAAMNACDHWRDSPQARMQMRLDIWETPAEMRRELLEHFQSNYPDRP